MSEKLSALIDNELEEFERTLVLKELKQDQDLSELWSRYHIIGLAMRREPVVPESDLVDRVRLKLENEAGPASAHSQSSAAWTVSSGVSIAASVVGVLLVGGLILKLYNDTQDFRPDIATPQIAFADEATRWEGLDPQTEDALNALLIEHGEFTSASGMNGLTAYTKFVAYDSP